MNADVARLVMDMDTTGKLGGIVAIDHYVKDTDKIVSDIQDIALRSGGRIVLSEFGAPIPDIHGEMSEKEQALWINKLMLSLAKMSELEGVNYWTSYGGSTRLWNNDDTPKEAAIVITKYYSPHVYSGTVINEAGIPLNQALIITKDGSSRVDDNGKFLFPTTEDTFIIKANGYVDQAITFIPDSTISMKKSRESLVFKILKTLYIVRSKFN